jgi:hypothetical protein
MECFYHMINHFIRPIPDSTGRTMYKRQKYLFLHKSFFYVNVLFCTYSPFFATFFLYNKVGNVGKKRSLIPIKCFIMQHIKIYIHTFIHIYKISRPYSCIFPIHREQQKKITQKKINVAKK